LSAFRRTLDLDPGLERARFLVETLSGEPCETVPREFVKAMYDTHAYRFDVNLVDELQYQRRARGRARPLGRSRRAVLGHLDVGCGTGLCGPLFRDVATRLVGGDLSPNMIEKARERGTHDELYAEDLTATLARGDVDLVLATDVLIYVDDLRETLEGAGKALRPGGLFSFSTEHEPGDNLTLQTSGRFSHSEGYVRRLAEEFGFAVRHADKTTIRKVGIDDDRDVDGRLYVLELTG
jgi:predicted TPR repeat methyltransferase